MIKTKEIRIGHKTLLVDQTEWNCIRCSGTGWITLQGVGGLATLPCQNCKTKSNVYIKPCTKE